MKVLLNAALLLTSLSFAPPTLADPFPSKTVTVIVGVAPGGTLDALARLVAKNMSTSLKQTVVVENVTGAGGLLGFQRLTRSEPDGYTLMFSNNSMVLIPLLHPKSGIDVVADTTPIGTVAKVPMVLSVSLRSGIKDLQSLLTRMKSPEPTINLGSGGPGTTAHLAEAMLLQLSGGKGELVQYRGSGPALTDLMSGNIEAVLDQTVTMIPLHQGKRVNAIAVSGKSRLPQLPDVPTFAEGGLPEFDLQIWNGLVAPKGTPKHIVDILAAALASAIDSQPYRERIEKLAAQLPSPAESGPAGMSAILVRDQKDLAGRVQQLGLQGR
jgi:tripartite-type tricarboxylate transporter receptor subunit TctC